VCTILSILIFDLLYLRLRRIFFCIVHFASSQVFKNSPAQEGGLKKFDFVTEIGGQRVETADDAHVVIDRAVIGEELSIKVMRDDTEITVQVKPEDLSPRLKQLREERSKRKKIKAKD